MRPYLTAAVLAAGLFSMAALADKTTTVLSAPSTITALHFYPPGDGGVMPSQACGRTKFADGGWTPVSCFDVDLPPGNAINVSVKSLAEGGALTFWRGQEQL